MALALSSSAFALRRALILCTAVLLGSTALHSTTHVHAQVFYSKQEALEIAFPDADRVETESFFLTQEEVEYIQSVAKAPIDSKLVTFHVGYIGEAIQGYAFIESHIVRTFAETFLIVISPEGALQTLVVLAFYEPPDYIPSDRWLQQFDQKTLSPSLRLRQDIDSIMGSTLTAQAVTQGVRKVLALHQYLILEKP